MPRPDQFENLYLLDLKAFGSDAYSYFYLRQLFDVHRRDFLVLETDDRMAGYVLAVRNSGESRSTIMSICVAPKDRRHGYGRELLEAALSRARDGGTESVVLTVKADNSPAVALYRACGFEYVRALPDHFGPGQDRDEMLIKLQ